MLHEARRSSASIVKRRMNERKRAVDEKKCHKSWLSKKLRNIVHFVEASRRVTLECINSYAILCTQSNDFVLGFPVLSSIYGVSHKEYHMYPYLLAPMSLASLNPIGFILMEIGKSRDSSIAISRVKIAMKTVQGNQEPNYHDDHYTSHSGYSQEPGTAHNIQRDRVTVRCLEGC